VDATGAQRETLDVAKRFGIEVTVSVAYEVAVANSGNGCFRHFLLCS